MVIDLKKCAERPLHVQDRFDLAARFASYPEVETIDAVEAELDVAPVGGHKFLVDGRFQASLTAYCVRCLEPFPVSIGESFRITYLPESERPADAHGEGEMSTGEIDIAYHRGEQLEVLPLLEEQINLAFPMRFLCAEQCRGLCQHCGANKNRDPCGCREPSQDPRLEVLKTLLD